MMKHSNSEVVLDSLMSSNMFLNRFVHDAIHLAAPIATACAHRSLLAEIPVLKLTPHGMADVEIQLNDVQQFERMKSSFQNDGVKFEIRPLRAVLNRDADTQPPDARDEYHAVPRAIFGFVGRYGAICIRQHARLDCLVVQFC